MARDLSKNTSNYLSLGNGVFNTLLSGLSSFSIDLWVNIDVINTGANDNRVFCSQINGESAGLGCFIRSVGGTPVVRVGARSVSTDTFRTRDGTVGLATGTWHNVGGVINIGADTITPYRNGVADNSGAAAFDNATYTAGTPTDADTIGSDGTPPSGTAVQFDGRVAEVAVWSGDIGASGFVQLAAGFSPLFVKPESLLFYMPLIGRYSPEKDVVSGASGTINGTVANADHPKIIYPSFKDFRRLKAAVTPPAVGVFPSHLTLLGIG